MKQISTKSGNIVCVEVPEDSFNYKIADKKEEVLYQTYPSIQYNYKEESVTLWQPIPEANDYKIIGKLSELTDKDCKEFVEFKKVKGQYEDCYYFKSYNHINNFTYGNAKQSFTSLLQSEDVDTNNEYLIIKLC